MAAVLTSRFVALTERRRKVAVRARAIEFQTEG